MPPRHRERYSSSLRKLSTIKPESCPCSAGIDVRVALETTPSTISRNNHYASMGHGRISGSRPRIVSFSSVGYRRAAFPEAFETRLRTKIDRSTLVEHIEAILNEGGEWIRCLLFELDDGDIRERQGPEDVYQLGITVLYASTPPARRQRMRRRR
jgi:hypothetical protein